MDKTLQMTIHKIKSINHAVLELPIENGVFAIVGNNGTGKSTIIYSFAQLINKGSLSSFGIGYGDGDSYVEFDFEGVNNRWEVKQDKFDPSKVYLPTPTNQIHINGMYEGSLFFGFRFQNYEKVKNLISAGRITEDNLSDADDYIIKNLGFILHGDENHYKKSRIVRIKNKHIVKSLGLNETPYFMFSGDLLVSQYGMSSGESLMLSLLHFIHNSIVRRSLDPKLPALMLIDEIEIALHPIAVSRLIDLLNDLITNREKLTVYITSHSPEVINKIKPINMFKLDLDDSDGVNSLIVTNPCYPSYAIRDVYCHSGYDWLLLVEDDLARIIVDSILIDQKINDSRLVHLTPVGGWDNVLRLQIDLLKNNVLGEGKKILSILDGDIENECKRNKKYKTLPKLFLPIASVEKYLKRVLLDKKDNTIYKRINDEFFQLRSLNSVVQDYKNSSIANDSNGKKFYKSFILRAVNERNIDEQQFIMRLAEIIKETVDFSAFNASITEAIQ
ncbi:MAG: ATP-binding protein [Desulfobacterales bacterium]|nr:ATP-binding protein [Desulfobacterales bacterium]